MSAKEALRCRKEWDEEAPHDGRGRSPNHRYDYGRRLNPFCIYCHRPANYVPGPRPKFKRGEDGDLHFMHWTVFVSGATAGGKPIQWSIRDNRTGKDIFTKPSKYAPKGHLRVFETAAEAKLHVEWLRWQEKR